MVELLIAELHGKSLRCITSARGTHFQGLGAAARSLRAQRHISNKMSNKLLNIDAAFGLSRHITAISVANFLSELDKELFKPESAVHPKILDTDDSSSESISTSTCTTTSTCISVPSASSPVLRPLGCRDLLLEQETSRFDLHAMDDMDDPLDTMESCLAEALHRLASTCHAVVDENVVDIEHIEPHACNPEVFCDPAIANTAGFYEMYLDEAKNYLSVLVQEFRGCAAAACSFNEYEECRLASDLLDGSDWEVEDISSAEED